MDGRHYWAAMTAQDSVMHGHPVGGGIQNFGKHIGILATALRRDVKRVICAV